MVATVAVPPQDFDGDNSPPAGSPSGHFGTTSPTNPTVNGTAAHDPSSSLDIDSSTRTARIGIAGRLFTATDIPGEYRGGIIHKDIPVRGSRSGPALPSGIDLEIPVLHPRRREVDEAREDLLARRTGPS